MVLWTSRERWNRDVKNGSGEEGIVGKECRDGCMIKWVGEKWTGNVQGKPYCREFSMLCIEDWVIFGCVV